MIANDLNVLLISSLSLSLEEIQGELEEMGCQVFTYLVKVPEEEIKRAEGKYCQEISETIRDKTINIVVADLWFYRHTKKNEYYEMIPSEDTCISFKNLVNGNYSKEKILKVILHTYSKDLFWFDIDEIEKEIDKEFGEGKTLLVETSTTFLKAKTDEAFFEKKPNPQLPSRITETLLSEYARDFAHGIIQVIEREILDRHLEHKSLLYTEEYGALKKLKALNAVIDKDEDKWKLKNDGEYKLGHITYISDILDHRDQHILDIPHRKYFDKIDEDLEGNDWTNKYYKKDGKYLPNQYCYYDYRYEEGKFHLYNYFTKDYEGKGKMSARDEELEDFLRVLHSSIFYDKDAWKKEVELNRTVKTSGQATIKLLYLFSGVDDRHVAKEIEEYTHHLNYSFWKRDDKNYTHDQISEDYYVQYRSYHLQIKDIAESTTLPLMINRNKSLEINENFKSKAGHFIHSIRRYYSNISLPLQDAAEMLPVLLPEEEKELINNIVLANHQWELIEMYIDAIDPDRFMNISATSCLGFLKHMEKNQVSKSSFGKVVTDESYNETLDKISLKDNKNGLDWKRKNIYLVLWNLWDNASKGHQKPNRKEGKMYEFFVYLATEDGIIKITFENEGEMRDDKINILKQDYNLIRNNEMKGLMIIRDCANRLGWDIASVEVRDGKTKIVISCPKI